MHQINGLTPYDSRLNLYYAMIKHWSGHGSIHLAYALYKCGLRPGGEHNIMQKEALIIIRINYSWQWNAIHFSPDTIVHFL